MPDAAEQAILDKFNRGEALTAEESKLVMGGPAPSPADSDNVEAGEEGEQIDLDTGKKKEEGTAESSSSEESQSAESASSSEKKEHEESSSSEQSSSDESIASSSETSESEESSSSAESKPKDEGKDTRSLNERLEGELGKPEGTEDLSTFNDREKGLFWALRAERKKRQEAEADRDVERFKKIKDENLRKEAEKRAQGDKEFKEKLDELLKGDDEWINKSDVRKLVELLRTPAAAKTEGSADEVDAVNRKNFIRVAAMNASDLVEQRRIKGEDLPDFDTTLNLAPQIIETNEEYKKQVAQAYLTGKNPAYLSYELIRKDPKFAALYKPGTAAPKKEPAAKPDASKEGKENLAKIKANEKKPKTTGATGAGGGDITDSKGNVYTLVQLMQMDDATFRKVPREVREKFLEQT